MTKAIRRSTLFALAATLLLAAGCIQGPKVESPLTGQYRHTCCNIRYEKPEVTDVNYQQGAIIPYGTRVQIIEVRKNAVRFQPDGHPEMTLVFRHGRSVMSLEQYLDKVFLTDDPRRAKKRPSAKVQKLIEQGAVEPGMTRSEVLQSIGYPPAHRTPSIESPIWTYWRNRWETFVVYFDGDKVDRIGR